MEAFQRCQTCNAKQKFWKALKWHQVSETPIFSEDARGRGSEVVFPLHVRKISPLRPRKTKLDPCSSGTSLRNTAYFTFTQPIYNAPKMEAFQRCQTCNAKFWKALKWQRASETFIFSEDARGRGSEVVFPLHARKISQLRPRKTRLDPCSSGTSLQNTFKYHTYSEFSQFIMLPKWKPFSGARHVMLNFERHWSDSGLQRLSFSQKMPGVEGLKWYSPWMRVKFLNLGQGKPD